jgi:L-amino acid N-acyltransferase YncA
VFTLVTVDIRAVTAEHWPQIWPIWHEIVAAGETYTWDPETDETAARALWLLPPPAEVSVAVEGDTVVGTATLKPNQPGLGAHVANASFMVASSATGRGVGRRLAEHVLRQARAGGYRAIQFNAVVSTNAPAVALWRSLGFAIVGTLPGAFRHRRLGYIDLYVMYRALD